MKNIVVSGATSFIGIHLLNVLLADKRNHVFAVVRPNSPHKGKLKLHENLTVLELSLQEIENMPYQISVPIDIFYHLAWEGTRVPARDDKLLQENNYLASIRAVRVANKLGCKIFVGIGSQAENGKCKGRITEKYIANPITEYGKAKLRTYQDGKELADSIGMKFIWARIFSVYGEDDFEGTLIMSAISKMIRNEEIPLTECTQSWDFLHVLDAAKALYMLGVHENSCGVYNIASGKSKKLRSFVEEMKLIVKSQSELRFGAIPYGSEGVISIEPIVEKVMHDTMWKPQISFEQGIRQILKNKQKI